MQPSAITVGNEPDDQDALFFVGNVLGGAKIVGDGASGHQVVSHATEGQYQDIPTFSPHLAQDAIDRFPHGSIHFTPQGVTEGFRALAADYVRSEGQTIQLGDFLARLRGRLAQADIFRRPGVVKCELTILNARHGLKVDELGGGFFVTSIDILGEIGLPVGPLPELHLRIVHLLDERKLAVAVEVELEDAFIGSLKRFDILPGNFSHRAILAHDQFLARQHRQDGIAGHLAVDKRHRGRERLNLLEELREVPAGANLGCGGGLAIGREVEDDRRGAGAGALGIQMRIHLAFDVNDRV